jgi:hypothetical protein
MVALSIVLVIVRLDQNTLCCLCKNGASYPRGYLILTGRHPGVGSIVWPTSFRDGPTLWKFRPHPPISLTLVPRSPFIKVPSVSYTMVGTTIVSDSKEHGLSRRKRVVPAFVTLWRQVWGDGAIVRSHEAMYSLVDTLLPSSPRLTLEVEVGPRSVPQMRQGDWVT